MLGLKKVLSRPKRSDKYPLSIFFYCDNAVTQQMRELNHLMQSSPNNLDRRATLIRQLKEAQHNLVNVVVLIMNQVLPRGRTVNKDFRAKYPDDVLLDQINGPIWFGAECIAAGSHIANQEQETIELQPLAIQLCKCMTKVREALREQYILHRSNTNTQKFKDLLEQFDHLWCDFEFRYVSLMCSVQSETQYYQQQDIVVMFCESTLRAMKKKYMTEEMIEMMDPAAMFAIPRLAIVCGLTSYPDGPLNTSDPPSSIAPFFKGYKHLLIRIKELLSYLTQEQLTILEQALCSAEGLGTLQRKAYSTTEQTPDPNSVTTSQLHNELEKPLEGKPCNSRSNGKVCEFVAEPLGSVQSQGLEADNQQQSSVKKPVGRKNRGPAGFASAEDLMQRLFVAISGVADQLQTNHAKEMRVILKKVFKVCQGEDSSESPGVVQIPEPLISQSTRLPVSISTEQEEPTQQQHWTQQNEESSNTTCTSCTCCHESFSWTRRRHRCRNCETTVCAKCSPYTLPLPKFGIPKAVRVCTNCYIHLLGEAVRRTAQHIQPITA